MAVEGEFEFWISCEDSDEKQREGWIKFAFDLLTEALKNCGIGGKLQAGYGKMESVLSKEEQQKKIKETENKFDRQSGFAYSKGDEVTVHLFQAMLYSLLPPEEASILHDVGFNSDGRKMKLFAMSWPSSASRPQFGAETVIFPLPITLTVTTPVKKLIEGFTCKALSKEYIRIGNNKFICNSIETEQQTANSTDLTVKTLSPITCYETVENNGKHYTRYLSPYDEKFQKAIFVNLIRKFRLLNPDHEIPDDDFRITPIGTLKERISMYDRRKNGLFPIKGWWGNFRIEGNMELLQIALDCGLGSKNSSGWGCVSK